MDPGAHLPRGCSVKSSDVMYAVSEWEWKLTSMPSFINWGTESREAPKSGIYIASTLRSIPQSSWRLMLPAAVAKLTESAGSTCMNSSSGWYS